MPEGGLLRPCDVLNSENEPGRLTVVSRILRTLAVVVSLWSGGLQLGLV